MIVLFTAGRAFVLFHVGTTSAAMLGWGLTGPVVWVWIGVRYVRAR